MRTTWLVVPFGLMACDEPAGPTTAAAPAVTSSTATTAGKQLVPLVPLGPLAGLKLEAKLATTSPIEAGSSIPIEATLVNISGETIPVVQVGDGSSTGWRPPYLFFTAEQNGRAVPPLDYGRCGNYDDDWTDEVVALAPGASLKLESSLSPDMFLDLQTAGTVELRVHYRYSPNEAKRVIAPPATMARLPAYELASNPVSVTITRPLELKLEALESLETGVAARVEDVFRLTITNNGDRARTIKAPARGRDARLLFEAEGDMVGPGIHTDWKEETPEHTIAAGDSAVVLGKGSVFERGHDGWAVEAKGKARLRVVYAGLRSNWATVTVH